MTITKEQLEERKNFIGASDVPAIMGVSPWSDAYRVWQEKLGLAAPFPGNIYTEFGNYVEPWLLETAAKRLGYRIEHNVRRVRDIFAANNDALVVDKPIGLEAKSTTDDSDWGEEGSDMVPEHVLLQTQAQAYCGDLDYVYVPALIAGRFRLYRVERNDDLIDMVVEKGEQFWTDHVLPKKAPEPGRISASILYEQARVAGKVAEIPDELGLAYQKAKAAEKEIKDILKELQPRIVEALGDAEIGEWEGGLITYKLTERDDLDSKRLKEERPDIAAEYQRTLSYRTMRQAKKPKGKVKA